MTPQGEATARAVAMVAAWMDSEDNRGALKAEALRTRDEGQEAAWVLTIGLVNLAGTLLMLYANTLQQPPQAVLQQIALRVQQI